VKFEKVVDNRLEVKRMQDYESRHKYCILNIGYKLENHDASIYTINVFGKVQYEFGKINQFTKKKRNYFTYV